MRLLFVYGYEPSGHASAARALEAAAVDAGHECVRVDVSSEINPLLGPAVSAVYLAFVGAAPRLWGRIYDNESAARLFSRWGTLYRLLFGARVRSVLGDIAPDAVVCTHAPPLTELVVERRRSGFTWPLVGVVTDFRAHLYWFTPEAADLYVTAGPETRLPVARVREFGIPVHPSFERPPTREKARGRMGFPGDVPVVVISGGSRGLGRLSALAEALLACLPRARVVVVCGGNRRLARELKLKAARHEGRLWVYEQIPPESVVEIMTAADVLIGKGGGVTAAECLAAGLPIVLFEPLPGQERRNADYLLERGAAVEAFTPEEAAAAAGRLLEPSQLEKARARARALGRPDAARRAVEAIVAAASNPRPI